MEFICFYIKHIEKYENKNESSFIILPPSYLSSIMSDYQYSELHFPLVFSVKNEKTRCVTFCTVYEFDSEEGKCLIPDWVMIQLGLEEGEKIIVEHYKEEIPKGQKVIVSPQTQNFYNEYDFLNQLETAFLEYYVLKKNAMISVRLNDRIYLIEIIETFPNDLICTIDSDIEIEFDNTFIEKNKPVCQSLPLPNLTNNSENIEETNGKFVPFSGKGYTLGTK